MSDLTTTATENQFYNELVNKFFHPKSYFFYCVGKYLDNPLLFTDQPDFSVTQITSRFIDYLSKSKQAAQDLTEISRIRGFENIFLSLKAQLIRYDLRLLDHPQLKKAIQNITLFFLKNFYQILFENKKRRDTLMTYLDIKTKLLELLNNSNGKHKHILKRANLKEPSSSDAGKARLIKPPSENNSFITNKLDLDSDSFDLLENHVENDQKESFEINTSFNKSYEASAKSSQPEHKSAIFPGFKIAGNLSEDVDKLLCHGDDDEELLKLFHEVSLSTEALPIVDSITDEDVEERQNKGSKAISPIEKELQNDQQLDNLDSSIKEAELVEGVNSQNTKVNENTIQEDNDDPGDNFDAAANQIFQHEAILYYKILLTAISKLKNEEKVPSALEDIELASSCLKQLAQKFRMERLALLPELIETISIAANQQLIKLPATILQNMEDGIKLLKEFDVNNEDHKKSVMSILTSLQEFCSKTLNMTPKKLD